MSKREKTANAVKMEKKESKMAGRKANAKRWRDLSPAQRGGNIVMGIVELVMTTLALLDIRRRSASEINGSKVVWALAAFIQPIGPISYFIFGRKKHAPSADAGQLLSA